MSDEEIESLFTAIEDGDLHKVEEILQNDSDKIIRAIEDDIIFDTPCCLAASQGRVDILQLLLNHGANVNLVKYGGDTPLHIAAYKGHVDILQLLLKHGVNVNLVNWEGETPLHKAAYQGHVECIKFLLKSGADIKARDNDGETPYVAAIRIKHKESVECLRNAVEIIEELEKIQKNLQQ